MKYVYMFDEGNKDMRNLLGGKGANLAEMTNMGLPVPYGFTITTDACTNYYQNEETVSENIKEEIFASIKKLEEKTNKKLGDTQNPLLVSVRSGSPISMPGMMDTILNLGLNDEIAKSLAKSEDEIRFVYDSYRRLIMMYADVVKGKSKDPFENLLTKFKENKGVQTDIELGAEDMYNIAMESKAIYKELTGEEFPEDPKVALMGAVTAVFKSWNNERAQIYREMNNISDKLGTAVNVQEMVYGNLSETSLTGVMFSRNPSTGEDKLYGEYLEKAQGEDIVAGVRTPKSLDILERNNPKIYNELNNVAKVLETHYKDMQDMEFTVENGKLYMLQTRNGKRTPLAALNIAVNMAEAGLITKEDAIMRIETKDIEKLLHKTFVEESLNQAELLTSGLPASPGAVSGKIYFTVEDILNHQNEDTILVRTETSPEDIKGMNYASGIVTVRGGMTSHAAVVARGMGKCCISGCSEITINEKNNTMTINDNKLKAGEFISLDGSKGNIYKGVIETTDAKITDNFKKLLSWAKEYKKIGVRANADTGKDALVALNFGAEGIGLCRSEHMFFEPEKIFVIRKLIIAKNAEERQKALDELLPMQQTDYENLFKAAGGNILTVRYLDPPLHEFLPKKDSEIHELAKALKLKDEEVRKATESLKEFNPMMGHRGCRLAITYPEITIMQTKALIGAAINTSKMGYKVKPEIMIPLVSDEKEFIYLKEIIENTIKELTKDYKIDYKIGTMIETPRSAVLAGNIAKNADFFSFGTNDLTQMTFGFSRDDAESFINKYYQKGILKNDPFKTIDQDGVGNLMLVAIKLAKEVNPNIELGVCGEHGGDEESVKFFSTIGIDYVSCSPYRVPIAILAAAKSALAEKEEN